MASASVESVSRGGADMVRDFAERISGGVADMAFDFVECVFC